MMSLAVRFGRAFALILLMLPRAAWAQEATEPTAVGAVTQDSAPHGTDSKKLRSKRGLSTKVVAGASYAELFGIPTYGGEISFSLGGRTNDTFAYGGLALERHGTEMGLPIWGGHMSFALEQRFGVFRAGAVARFGFWRIQRVTEDDWMESPSVGGALRASVDLLRGDEGRMFVQAELRGDCYFSPCAPGANLSLGYGWDAL